MMWWTLPGRDLGRCDRADCCDVPGVVVGGDSGFDVASGSFVV